MVVDNQLDIDKNSGKPILVKIAMVALALCPILHWYDIGAPVGLGDMIIMGVSFVALFFRKFDYKVLPKSFFLLWFYISINWYANNPTADWKSILPGGILFVVFVLNLSMCITLFDIDVLHKCMRWIVISSIVLFAIQFFTLHLGGYHICFVPKITNYFIYNGYSYSELYNLILNSDYPSAFFLEKSYMAYYLVMYLCLDLFLFGNSNILLSRLSILIICTLLILKSGSGLIGMSIPVTIKIFIFYWNKSKIRYSLLLLVIPIYGLFIYMFSSTKIGASLVERQSEITTEGTSGFARVSYGYVFFENLSPEKKIFGTSISDIINRTYLSYSDSNFALNGIQRPLIQLGLFGLILWILFYISIFKKNPIHAKACILTCFILAAIEVTYLGSYMLLLTVIPCAYYYRNNNKNSTAI